MPSDHPKGPAHSPCPAPGLLVSREDQVKSTFPGQGPSGFGLKANIMAKCSSEPFPWGGAGEGRRELTARREKGEERGEQPWSPGPAGQRQ